MATTDQNTTDQDDQYCQNVARISQLIQERISQLGQQLDTVTDPLLRENRHGQIRAYLECMALHKTLTVTLVKQSVLRMAQVNETLIDELRAGGQKIKAQVQPAQSDKHYSVWQLEIPAAADGNSLFFFI